jgi:hypothetical protein
MAEFALAAVAKINATHAISLVNMAGLPKASQTRRLNAGGANLSRAAARRKLID